jgi:lipoprotein-anchoring transpeptidase ErfK/SrfK
MTKKRIQKSGFKWSFFLILLIATLAFGFLIITLSINRPFCANSDSCKESFSLNVENDVKGIYSGQEIVPPKINLTKNEPATKVLGEAILTGEKHIYINLTTQTLTAYQGDAVFMEAQVSTGKWKKTPIGEFTIWEKLRSTKMSGGSGSDYYYLPNVPYVMFFEGSKAPAGAGFGLHGAYWHNNFGHPMSHGCVNMKEIDAKKLYNWVSPTANGNITRSTDENPGTKITIYGQAPD